MYSRLAGPWCFWGLSGLHLPNHSMEHLGYRQVHYFVWLHAGSEDSNSGNGKHHPSHKNHFKVSLIVQKDDFLVFALWLGRLSIKLMFTIPLYNSLLLSLWLAYPHSSPSLNAINTWTLLPMCVKFFLPWECLTPLPPWLRAFYVQLFVILAPR